MQTNSRNIGIRLIFLVAASVVALNAYGQAPSSGTTPAGSVGCAPPPPGLFAWYKAEGDARDSANANHGTAVRNVGYVPAEAGFGFSLRSGSAFVGLPNNLFPYPTSGKSGNAPFSFETWFNTQAGGVILGQQNSYVDSTPSAYVPAVYVGTDGRLYVSMFWDYFTQIVSPGTVNDGAYHHVAVAYDGSNETVYLDGRVMGSVPFTQIGYADDYWYQLGTGYTAGRWPAANGGWFYFNGIIDEASIYNRALTASEVATIYAADGNGKCQECFPPQITTQPTNQTVVEGHDATFTVTLQGSDPKHYQWQLNGTNLTDSTHYAGASFPTLTVRGVGPGDAGSYQIVVTNPCGAVTSAPAILTVQPQSGCAPAPAGLIAWYKAEGNANDSADSHDGSTYHVQFVPGEVGLGFFFDGQNWVDLPVNLFPYPVSGQNGNAPFSFETWFSTTAGGVILGQQEGDQSGTPFGRPSAYVPAVYVGTDGRLYASMFWDNFTQISSAGIVNDGSFHHVAVTYDGTTESVFLDGVVIGSARFTQIGYAPRYYYQLGTGYTGGLWPGGNNDWFFFKGVIDEASVYNRALTISEVAAIVDARSGGKCPPNRGGAPQITRQPANQTVPAGSNPTFSVSATGSSPLSYQWQMDGRNLGDSAHYQGATNSTLTIIGAQPSDQGSYRVLVSNASGSITSAVATLTVTQQGCTPAPPGLIAWYRAEGNAQDSADSHNGTMMNAATFGPGKVGTGFNLAGGSAYVQLPPNLFPYPTSGNTGHAPFSFETWFIASGSDGGVILGQQEGDPSGQPFATPNGYVPAIYVGHDGRLYVMMFWSDFGQIISPGSVMDGLFHHVAVTYDGTIETVYLDGAVIGSRYMTQVGYANNYYYQLGTGYSASWPAGNNGWFPFQGGIDEASVYNRALTPAEVQAVFAAGSGGKCPVRSEAPASTTGEAFDTSNFAQNSGQGAGQ